MIFALLRPKPNSGNLHAACHNHAITRAGKSTDLILLEEIVHLYETEPDLRILPQALFGGVTRLVDADIVSYAKFYSPSKAFRMLVSVDDDQDARMRAAQAFFRHMHSHPFWTGAPNFFGERVLRESDLFSNEEFFAMPIAQEAFLPSHAHRQMRMIILHNGYVISMSMHRVVGLAVCSETRSAIACSRIAQHLLRYYCQAR